MRGIFVTLFAVVLILMFLFPVTAVAAEVIRVGGVGSALGTMKLIGQAFAKVNPGIKVEVIPSLGSTGGIKAVIKGAIAVGLSGRPLTEEEKTQGAVATEYARAPFVFVTNNKSTLGLTTEELVQIYEGKRTSWPDGKPLRLVLRPENDSATLIIKSISPEMNLAVKAALSRHGMIMAITDQESLDTAEGTPDSLSATALDQIISEKRLLGILSFNGMKPGGKSPADGLYPLVKPYYVVFTDKTSAPAKKLISFIFSPAGKRILEANGCTAMKKKER